MTFVTATKGVSPSDGEKTSHSKNRQDKPSAHMSAQVIVVCTTGTNDLLSRGRFETEHWLGARVAVGLADPWGIVYSPRRHRETSATCKFRIHMGETEEK
jgi:hypothetical protein